MTSSNNKLPPPEALGLYDDAALRYVLIQIVAASPSCAPNAYMTTVDRLMAYIRTGSIPDIPPITAEALQRYRSRAGVGAGVWTFDDPPVPQHGSPRAGQPLGGQTHTLRQEDQSRG